jgi:hypothetical protein
LLVPLLSLLFVVSGQVIVATAATTSSASASTTSNAVTTATTTSAAVAFWTYDRPANLALTTRHRVASSGLAAVSALGQHLNRTSGIGRDRAVAAEGDVAATEPAWGPGTPAAGQPPDEPTIDEILKGKLGSIQRAPLPSGSPSWTDITNMTLSEIRAGAQENLPGYRTILKLLSDSRFNK